MTEAEKIDYLEKHLELRWDDYGGSDERSDEYAAVTPVLASAGCSHSLLGPLPL
jgi:hypothetical protein